MEAVASIGCLASGVAYFRSKASPDAKLRSRKFARGTVLLLLLTVIFALRLALHAYG